MVTAEDVRSAEKAARPEKKTWKSSVGIIRIPIIRRGPAITIASMRGRGTAISSSACIHGAAAGHDFLAIERRPAGIFAGRD